MRAAILARGGSIWKTWPKIQKHRDFDFTIAINTTINFFQADWLCALDSYTYKALKHAPTVGYVYHSGYVTSTVEDNKPAPEIVADKGPAWQHLQAVDAGMDKLLKDNSDYSVMAAIWFAVLQGAIFIDLFGVDFGKDYGEVISAKGVRTNEALDRFHREGASVMQTAFSLAQNHVSIERWEPDDDE